MWVAAKRCFAGLVPCLVLILPVVHGLAAETDVPLADRLGSSDWNTLYSAIGEVDALPLEERVEFLPQLTGLLNHDDQSMRIGAADTLCDMGALARDAIPVIIQNFAQPHGEEAAGYPDCVERMGAVAVPALIDALADPNPFVRESSIITLGRLGGPDALAALEDLLAHPGTPQDASNALRAIAWITAPPTLEGRLAADNPLTRDAAYHEVMALKPAARIPYVRQMERYLVENDRKNTFFYMARALCETGRASEAMIPIFIARLNTHQEHIYPTYVDCVAGYGAAAVPQLIGVLDHDGYYLRARALETLARIGPPAKAALPALRSILARPAVRLDVSKNRYKPRIQTVNLAPLAQRALTAIEQD